jgi:hypothetical protein
MKKLVKIKTWYQMEKVFGLDEDGDIDIPGAFVKDMEENMPENRIIVIEEVDSSINNWFAKNENWGITDEMIEEYLDPKDYPEYLI